MSGIGAEIVTQCLRRDTMPRMTTGIVDVVAVAPAAPRRSRRRLWIALAAVVVLLAGGVVASVSIGLRYAHAAPLECACALGWDPPGHGRTVRAGPYSAMIAQARPGQVQSFYVMISNPAPVTQTVLGLQYPNAQTAEPEQLAVALPGTSTLDDQQDYRSRQFTTKPTAIPPQGIRWLRVTIHTAPAEVWGPGREEFWTDLYVRVRVGWFHRDETVHLEDTAFVLQGT
jgi:hypothetical protein